jgi:hypothetical protein
MGKTTKNSEWRRELFLALKEEKEKSKGQKLTKKKIKIN